MLVSSMAKRPGRRWEMPASRPVVVLLLIFILYATILGFTAHLVYSKSGFLILGLGSVVLLDRYLFRLLPWKRPVAWARELSIRAGYFSLGCIGFYLSHPGVIRAEEVLLLGVTLSLAAFVFDAAWGGLLRMVSRRRFRLQILGAAWL